MTFNVLGIGYGGHDTAACILKDDKLIAAISQERLDLQKHSRSFPIDAIKACLKAAELTIDDINEIKNLIIGGLEPRQICYKIGFC